MLVRRDGTLLVSRFNGEIVAVETKGQRVVARVESPATALSEASDGSLWGGSVNGAVWMLENGSARVVSHELAERVVALWPTRDGRHVWAASLGTGAVRLNRQGIDRKDPAQRLVVTRANGLLGETLWTILEDREGNLWFGQNGGASRLRKGYGAFFAWTERSVPPLPDQSTFAVLPEWRGARWVGHRQWTGES